DGVLWLGYHDHIYRVKDGQATELTMKEGVPSGTFHSLISDGAGNIWLGKGDEIAVFKDGKFCQMTNLFKIQCLAASQTNAVWLVAGLRLFTCDTSGKLRDHGLLPCHPRT